MTTLFFVHGTGVREESYRKTKTKITQGFIDAGIKDVKVQGVSWGRIAGTQFDDHLIDLLIPATAAKSIAGLDDEELTTEIWEGLLGDPGFELRLMGQAKPLTTNTTFGDKTSAAEDIRDRVQALPNSDDEWKGGVSHAAVKSAAVWLTTDRGLSLLSGAAGGYEAGDDPELVDAVAHCLVAKILSDEPDLMGGGPTALYNGRARDELVEQIESKLGLSKGLGSKITGRLGEWAQLKATRFGEKKRKHIMEKVSPGMGDIIFTQRRGEDVLNLLKTNIDAIPDDVVIIGHSLGGVLAMDLLTRSDKPENVTKLITVGSQPSFFGGADGLANLRLGTRPYKIKLPNDFVPWLNVFDPADFLSFLAEGLFESDQELRDFELRSGAPFPQSHGAYFDQDRMYNVLVDFIGL